ncbi:MAG: ferritin family protein [Candidatus Altiarchaeota archaeon]
MDEENPKEILDKAVEIEKAGYKFYMEAAWQCRDENGKRMFESLATDELDHIKTFSAQLNSISESGNWLSVDELVSSKKEISAHEEEVLSWVETNEKVFSRCSDDIGGFDDKEAILCGINAEKKAISLYSDAAEKSKSPHAKEIYAKLAAEEEGHKHILQAELDSLEKNGFWFDHAEFRLENA